MKDIYLLLTKSDTFISKAIYLVTQDSYTHISISFEENLQPMYSCARKYTYSPIPAGIRNESFEKGFYNKNQHISILFIIMQRFYVDGLTGAVKG